MLMHTGMSCFHAFSTCPARQQHAWSQVLKGKQDERTARAFVREMAILRSCLHPQILQYMVFSRLHSGLSA